MIAIDINMVEDSGRTMSVRTLSSTLTAHPLLALFYVAVVYIVYVRYFTPLRKIPGPFFGSLTRLWKVTTILTARQEVKIMELHRKYGQ